MFYPFYIAFHGVSLKITSQPLQRFGASLLIWNTWVEWHSSLDTSLISWSFPSNRTARMNKLEKYKASIPEYTNSDRIQRLQSLYSDFTRLRQTNQRGYQANMDWWRGALSGIMEYTFTVDDDTPRQWQHPVAGQPRCLGVVVEGMVHDGALYPLEGFMGGKSNSHTHNTRSARTTQTTLEWLFASLGLGGSGGGDYESPSTPFEAFERACGKYVVVARVQSLAAQVVDHHLSCPPTKCLYTRRLFAAKYSLAPLDADVVLKWLTNDGYAVVEGEAVKVVGGGCTTHSNQITQIEAGIIAMVDALNSVDAQIGELDVEIGSCSDTIASHLRSKDTDRAKRSLRSRKTLQDVLQKRLDSRENLQHVLLKIEQSVGDIEIMKAYEMSDNTLKTLLKAPELDKDRVEDTMDSLSHTLADHGEIEQAIARPGAAEMSGEMEDEVEEEYRRLLEGQEGDKREEKREKEKTEKDIEPDTQDTQDTQDIRLPSPPTDITYKEPQTTNKEAETS
ncbi:hypothetical protein E3P77_02690 [Wallemia ichthyophaga]|nr:hypothetical protein E3P77_02690 [Wallemia ichthyophaga]